MLVVQLERAAHRAGLLINGSQVHPVSGTLACRVLPSRQPVEDRSALDIFVKDMGLVTGAAAEAGAPVPLSAAARELYQHGHDQGRGRQDDSALIEVLRHR